MPAERNERQSSARVRGGAPTSEEESRRSGRGDLRAWYSDGLRSKVAQAVTEGRVDAQQAADFHRLMNELVRRRGRAVPSEAEEAARRDRRS